MRGRSLRSAGPSRINKRSGEPPSIDYGGSVKIPRLQSTFSSRHLARARKVIPAVAPVTAPLAAVPLQEQKPMQPRSVRARSSLSAPGAVLDGLRQGLATAQLPAVATTLGPGGPQALAYSCENFEQIKVLEVQMNAARESGDWARLEASKSEQALRKVAHASFLHVFTQMRANTMRKIQIETQQQQYSPSTSVGEIIDMLAGFKISATNVGVQAQYQNMSEQSSLASGGNGTQPPPPVLEGGMPSGGALPLPLFDEMHPVLTQLNTLEPGARMSILAQMVKTQNAVRASAVRCAVHTGS